MNIYVAASFAYEDKTKTEERKLIIEGLVSRMKQHLPGDYFLPHQMKIKNAWDYSLAEWGSKVFEEDIKHLDAADIVLFISFGKENNAGAAWEVGYAAAKGKKIIVIKVTEGVESLMITNSAYIMIRPHEIDLIDWDYFPRHVTAIDKLS